MITSAHECWKRLFAVGNLGGGRVKAPPCLPGAEIDRATAAYRALVAREGLPEPVACSAEQMLARSRPPHWALEWSLPWWLGEALGLTTGQARSLVLANVFGLTYIRLQDDLVDGVVASASQVSARLLGTALLRTWLELNMDLCAAAPAFWRSFDSYLQQWLAATWLSHQPVPRFSIADRADLLVLAQRGAPLKSCAAAACVLADRRDRLAQLETLLDDLLIAAVLLDHAQDWAEDVAAGRWNAFVAQIIGPGAPQDLAHGQRAVWQEMAVGAAGRPYFAVIGHYLRSAQGQAEAVGLGALAGYIGWLAGAAGALRRKWVRAARQQLRTATAVLLNDIT